MHRRQFLASASALALAATLPALNPTPAFSLESVLEVSKIEKVLTTLEDYGFGLTDKARVLGIDEGAVFTYEDLRRVVHKMAFEYRSRDFWDRVRAVYAIREELDKRFGALNLDAHRVWLSLTGGGFSVRELLQNGEYFAVMEAHSTVLQYSV